MLTKSKWSIGIIIILCLVVMSGCSFRSSTNLSAAEVIVTSTDWTDFKRSEIQLQEGQHLAVDYASEIDAGYLSMKLYTESDDVLVEFGVGTTDKMDLIIEQSGDYYLMIVGEGFDGELQVKWTIDM